VNAESLLVYLRALLKDNDIRPQHMGEEFDPIGLLEEEFKRLSSGREEVTVELPPVGVMASQIMECVQPHLDRLKGVIDKSVADCLKACDANARAVAAATRLERNALTPDQRAQLVAAVKESYRNGNQDARPIVFGPGEWKVSDVKAVSDKPREMDFKLTPEQAELLRRGSQFTVSHAFALREDGKPVPAGPPQVVDPDDCPPPTVIG